MQDVYEDTALYIAPSAKRAFTYATHSLDALDGERYDIKRAKRLFLEAASLESTFPYLQHQLARIAFLEGNFSEALSRINLEIERDENVQVNSYYIRALIKGFRGEYDSAAEDYEKYLESDPYNWAAINDYAWVLLKAGKTTEAVSALEEGLKVFPENAWLLSSYATALYEIGDSKGALKQNRKALVAVAGLTEDDWLLAYPGNDPRVAAEGLAAFRRAVEDNMHTLERAQVPGTVE